MEIYKNNKLIKPRKKKLVEPEFNLNFSSIRSLNGNKIILEHMFQINKMELLDK
jgi:hypothetical protein